MEERRIERLDVFPYRNRLADIMSAPPVIVPASMPLREAARVMERLEISSVLAATPSAEGRIAGILTERDLLRAVARDGGEALERAVGSYMTAAVKTLPPGAMVYQAIGAMTRLGVRHVPVVDEAGRAVGIVTARSLLKHRTGEVLLLGDDLAVAETAEDMARVRGQLPALTRELLGADVHAVDIAAVISEVMRDMTARAGRLAEAEMAEAGDGDPPAPYCVLVLGSGGRGESLLAPDQDNAVLHAGRAGDDAWFLAWGERMTRILDEAGVPYCRGGVMASRPVWCHNLGDWRDQVDRWIADPVTDHLLNVDIFFDLWPVSGSAELAQELRGHALDRAAAAPGFLRALSAELDAYNPPLGFLGGFRADGGRLDLKLGGLFPIVAGARTMALRLGAPEIATQARLRAVHAAGWLPGGDVDVLIAAHDLLLRLILAQQVADMDEGRPPGPRVDVVGLSARDRRALKEALRRLQPIASLVRDALMHD